MKILLVKNEGDVIDITELSSPIKIKGAAKESTRTLQFSTLRPYINEHLPDVVVNLGDTIEIYDDEELIYKGVVWDRETEDNSIEVDITCYDLAIYLNKSDPKEVVYTDKTPQDVTSTICKELGLGVGELAEGEKMTVNGRGMKAYDIIMLAYTNQSKKDDKKYKLVAKGDDIHVFESGKKHDIVLEELNEALPGKLLNTSYRDTMDNLINAVEAIDEKKEDKQEDKADDKESQEKYGKIQKIIRGDAEAMNAALEDVTREVTVEVIADWQMQTGMSIALKSEIIEGEFYIIDDDHEWKDGVHTATLKLSTEFEMDTREEGQQKQEQAVDEFGGAAPGSVQAALNWGISKIGWRYSQPKRRSVGYADCSSLVMRSFQSVGLLPRGGYNLTSRSIHGDSHFVRISRDQLRPGDVLWHDGHLAFYVGGNRTLEARWSTQRVGYSTMGNRFSRFYRIRGT